MSRSVVTLGDAMAEVRTLPTPHASFDADQQRVRGEEADVAAGNVSFGTGTGAAPPTDG